MNPYTVLGIPQGASAEDAKTAFKKLASKYHPDKHVSSTEVEKKAAEEKFKEAKLALDSIESGAAASTRFKSGHFGSGEESMDDLIAALRRNGFTQGFQNTARVAVAIKVPIADAFKGCIWPISVSGQSIGFRVPPGIPHKSVIEDEVPFGDSQRKVLITILLESGAYRHREDMYGMHMTGDLEVDQEVDALDILMGAYIVVKDFTGAQLQVRIPAGFNTDNLLKVTGRGYTRWNMNTPIGRGDMYVKVKPIFKTTSQLDKDKVATLYEAVHGKAPGV